jgi:hypothetical protein
VAEAVGTSPALRCCERLAAATVGRQRLAAVLLPVPTPRSQTWLRGLRPRHLATAAGILAALLLLGLGLTLRQRWQLEAARERWSAMGARVEATRAHMNDAKVHAAWLGDQPESLDVLRAVTLAFPERGTVWVTRLELKDRRLVTIAGKAASRDVWLQTLEALRQTPGVRELRVSQARTAGDGKSPMTFALSFTWQPAAAGRRSAEGSP